MSEMNISTRQIYFSRSIKLFRRSWKKHIPFWISKSSYDSTTESPRFIRALMAMSKEYFSISTSVEKLEENSINVFHRNT